MPAQAAAMLILTENDTQMNGTQKRTAQKKCFEK